MQSSVSPPSSPALSHPISTSSQGFDPFLIKPEPPKPWDQWTLKDFEIGKPLAEGTYGHVYLARTAREKRIIALKVLHIKQIVEDNMEAEVERETEIHLDLEHENIIKMIGYFKDEDKIAYVLEYAPGGDVFSELVAQPETRFTDGKAATYLFQLSNALEYLHGKHIIHRDLKLENLLIGYFGEIKLADFGSSLNSACRNATRRMTICGTINYMAPEVLDKSPYYDEKVDLWSLGVVCYEFLVGDHVIDANSVDAAKAEMKMTKIKFPKFVSFHAKALVRKMLVKNPLKRPTLLQVREHAWVQKNRSTEKKLLPIFDRFSHLEEDLKEHYNKAAIRYNKEYLENQSKNEKPREEAS